jgi:iron complex outermembrane receptor protein
MMKFTQRKSMFNQKPTAARRTFTNLGVPVALVAFSMPLSAAWAQTIVEAPPVVEAGQPAQQPTATAANTAPVDVVVVTAQRRKERVVNVPISITSVSADRLESVGVNDTMGLAQVVPGLRMDASGSFAQPSIRGVGSALAGPGMNSNVAIYVDGFYVPNLLGSDFDLLSITSVDVLKGPQGTLFGRNATGGAILVSTREPSSTPTATVSASYASFNRSKLSVYGSTGLSPALAFDVAGVHEEGDGYVRNIVTGNKDGKFTKDTLRAKMVAKITDWAKLTLTLEHRDINDPTGNATNSYEGLSIGSTVPGTVVAQKPRETSGTAGAKHTFKGDSALLRGDFDLGFADLTSYTMSRNEKGFELKDYDSTPLDAFTANWQVLDKTVSQELTLASKGRGSFTWVGGLFYYRNKNEYPSFNSTSGTTVTTHSFDSSITQESRAVFVDATYEVAKDWFATGGLRYSRDHSDATFNAPAAPLTRHAEHTWTNTSPRAVLRYQVTPDSNVYGSYTLGYKAGIIPITEGVTPVEPEKINAIELGYKIAKPGFRFDASAFSYDYKNLQVASYIGTISLTRNAAQSKISGLDFQLSQNLGSDFKLNLGGTYTKANYGSFPGAVDYVQRLVPGQPGYGTFSNPSVDASGNMMLRTPRFAGNIGLSYNQPLAEGNLVLSGNYYHTSKFYFDPVNRFSQDAYGLLNASATWTDARDRWSLSVFGKNITNTTYRSVVLPGPFSIQQAFGEPASIGMSVSYRY